ncbi:MAG: TetR/AcrR family transcriptional regulator [Oscillospiraceae bacterium]|nr:TetR/AcrR family transcriptional regulator [Oscillospiraceae bacterium]
MSETSLDTKSKIIIAAATLFCEVGYEKTTLRMIGERVGIRHVSIFNHFSNKTEIGGQIIKNYFQGHHKQCYAISSMMDLKEDDEEYYRNILFWALHYKIHEENEFFRKFYISYFSEESTMLASSSHASSMNEFSFLRFTVPERRAFINRSLIMAIDSNLASLIDISVIDYVQATELVLSRTNGLDVNLSKLPDEEEIRTFASEYLPKHKIDILKDILLMEYQ